MSKISKKSKIASIFPYKVLTTDNGNFSQVQIHTRLETLVKLPFVKSPSSRISQDSELALNPVSKVQAVNRFESSKNLDRLQHISWTPRNIEKPVPLVQALSSGMIRRATRVNLTSIKLVEVKKKSEKHEQQVDVYKISDDLYQSNKVSWSISNSYGDIPNSCEFCQVAVIEDELFLCGGQNTKNRSGIKVMNLKTRIWTSFASHFPLQGIIGNSVIAYRKKLYVYGGYSANGPSLRKYSKKIVCISTQTGMVKKHRIFGELPKPRRHHCASILGNYIFIYGGILLDNTTSSDLYVFNIKTHSWDTFPESKQNLARSHASLTALFKNSSDISTKHEKISSILQKSLLKNSGFYLFGGLNEIGNCNNSLYCLSFSRESNQWAKIEPKGDIPRPRYSHAAVSMDYRLFIFGGRTNDRTGGISESLGDLHIFNSLTLRWEQIEVKGSLPESRWGHAMAAYGRQILLFGGLAYNGLLHADLYCLETNPDANATFRQDTECFDI